MSKIPLEMNKDNFKKTNNPKGPFTIDIKYKGIDFNVVIDSTSLFEYDVKVKTKNKKISHTIDSLKEYLEYEGFLDAARKHNLFW